MRALGAYRGTPVRFWLDAQLADIFGVTVRPSAATADAIYDQIADRLATTGVPARALFERFGIEVLATTDDPCDDLAAHRRLADDPRWTRAGGAPPSAPTATSSRCADLERRRGPAGRGVRDRDR